jgi:hypothetical protein
VEVTILPADVRAFLDNLKAPLNLVEFPTKYYEYLIRTVLESLEIATDNRLLLRVILSLGLSQVVTLTDP